MPGDSEAYIRFSCPCGGSLTVRADEAKKVASCPFCETKMRIVKAVPNRSSQSNSGISRSGNLSSNSQPSGIQPPIPTNTINGSLTETANVFDSQSQSPSRSESQIETELIPEWTPNRIVKPGAKKIVQRTYTNQSKASTSERDLYVMVFLATLCVLLVGGFIFWYTIKKNKSQIDDGLDGFAMPQVERVEEIEEPLPEVAAADDGAAGEVVPDRPMLKSPCIRFLGCQHSVVQALLADASDVVGDKLFLDIELENLSGHELSSITFEVICFTRTFKRKRFQHDEKFKKPLQPGEVVEITLTNEWNNWDSVEIWGIAFGGEGLENSDRVGPLAVKDEE